mmetsp:Transcript_26082/g.62836  ORF Transcript_26082/g.62836 Transcript_26082/m.62836 type:complete len:356 (+) Transcript_26082:369-1436(+)|eukprot:CAMPEP_0114523658 /NCGR_PEP_ID=MMETSP0109-20121206/21413_1 /TAXON_ID=29199 /ORGANISM="Chlorarachnion reptans, Strain CCCM449" /LENGTH=355 /DNA_ID=CAMNT_0001704997 /DNA_START=185 /DNA_END=1252 /DNA_ORIENTATION=+
MLAGLRGVLGRSRGFLGLATSSVGEKKAVVIGGTGYVGSHVVAQLLGKRYKVRATSRDTTKALWLQSLVTEDKKDRVELFELQLSSESPPDEKMDQLLNGADAVFFCAGFEHQDPSTIDFMVNNALATVKAAKRQKVPCVVLTSSGGSTNPPGLANETPKKELEHWSDPEAQKANGRFSPAAKTLMEINALKAVGRDQQNTVVAPEAANGAPRLCIVNPNLILGPQLQPGTVSGNSLPWVVRILKGETMNEKVPNDSMSIIDVRDLAKLHVACMEQETASGRYFAVNKSFPWEEILTAFEEKYPNYKKPPRFEGAQAMPTQFDFTRRDSLGVDLHPLGETVNDLVEFLKERGELQ